MALKRDTKVMVLSIVIAIFLAILILPHWAQYFRPQWILLVLIYWSLYSSGRIGAGVAWCLGILLDLLNGTLLGEHALALTLVIYLVIKLQRQIRMFPMMQQIIMVFIISLIYLAIIYILQSIFDVSPSGGFLYWITAAISAICWPWVSRLLNSWNKNFEKAL
jgi:rod shape-determining protein MreD